MAFDFPTRTHTRSTKVGPYKTRCEKGASEWTERAADKVGAARRSRKVVVRTEKCEGIKRLTIERDRGKMNEKRVKTGQRGSPVGGRAYNAGGVLVGVVSCVVVESKKSRPGVRVFTGGSGRGTTRCAGGGGSATRWSSAGSGWPGSACKGASAGPLHAHADKNHTWASSLQSARPQQPWCSTPS